MSFRLCGLFRCLSAGVHFDEDALLDGIDVAVGEETVNEYAYRDGECDDCDDEHRIRPFLGLPGRRIWI